MTEKLYYLDSEMFSFEAEVLSSTFDENKKSYKTILNKTCFYPEGGGQLCDKGTISDDEVIFVTEVNDEIIHYTKKEHQIGEKIIGEIDKKYRILMMQQHTGEHIVSGIVNKIFGYDNVGFHMGSDAVTLDFNGNITDEQLLNIENLANDAVFTNEKVEIFYPTKDELKDLKYRSKKEIAGQIRIVKTGNYDICACCGTHLKTIGQVGMIKFINKQKYKNGVRIFMLVGDKAREDYNKKNEMTMKISELTSTKPYEIVTAIEKMQEDIANLKISLSHLKKENMNTKFSNLDETIDNLIIFEKDLDGNELREYATLLSQKCKIAVVATECGENLYKYAVCSKNIDCKALSKDFNAILNGKGGGNEKLVQGTFNTTKEKISEYFEKM